MRKFACDFETNVSETDCRVWAYSIAEIGKPNNFIYGNNIEDFITWCANPRENYYCYFHNLKFDIEYLFSYLLNNDYKCIKDKKDKADKTFTTLISNMGQVYSLEIFFQVKNNRHVNKVTIIDSLKILNFSVDKIAKDFKLPVQKLDLDYETIREEGHELTQHEIDYIRNDVVIMAMALDGIFKQKLTKMTIGSDALHHYKTINKNFKTYFPMLNYEIDRDIRDSYKGGFTYLNDIYKEKETGSGIVFDYNSLYPSVMLNERLPFGQPIFFEGEYQHDPLYPLYVQKIVCTFKLKPGFIPTIQIKKNPAFIPNEYIKDSGVDPVVLMLTNIDLQLFFKHYDVNIIKYDSGWKFKAIKGLFTEYITYWSNQKIQAKKDDNGLMYSLSKLMLNSLYGKFGLNPKVRGKYPILDDGVVRYKFYDEEIRNSIYIPLATFVTSYGRSKTITASQQLKEYTLNKYGKDLYTYSDTDSIHILLDENEVENLKQFLDIDDYKIGALKLESKFRRAKYLRQKCYIEDEFDEKINDYKLKVTVAGFPKKLSNLINFKNFKVGFTTEGMNIKKKKLTYKHVCGGVLLVNTDFTIK